jgi:hypothetical protein
VQAKNVNSNAVADDMFLAFIEVQQIMKALSGAEIETEKIVVIIKLCLDSKEQ